MGGGGGYSLWNNCAFLVQWNMIYKGTQILWVRRVGGGGGGGKVYEIVLEERLKDGIFSEEIVDIGEQEAPITVISHMTAVINTSD